MKTKNFFAHLSAITVLAAVTTLFYGCDNSAPYHRYNDDLGKEDADFRSGELNGFEYVDLGLPSGTLWATTNANIDATYHTYMGDFYAWGETEGHNGYYGKAYYDRENNGYEEEWGEDDRVWRGDGGGYQYKFTWDNYKYSSYDAEGHVVFSRYCQQPMYGLDGYTDTLTVLAEEDMPMHYHPTRKNWKVPTKAQWEELIANTQNKWYVASSKYKDPGYTRNQTFTTKVWKGWMFMGKNGKLLFLPASGCFYSNEPFPGDSIIEFCERGIYWAREMYKPEQGPYNAWAMCFEDHNWPRIFMTNMPRCYGLSIRLVHDPK